jgi:hypothetical protein
MSNISPVFMLTVARALVKEVDDNTRTTLEAIRDLGNRDTGSMGFLGAVTENWKIGKAQKGLIEGLKRNLTIAMSLCGEVYNIDPATTMEAGETAHEVTAMAFFQQAVLALGLNDPKGAVKNFEESLKYSADQGTMFNIGLCFSQMPSGGMFGKDYTPDAVSAFQKCIDMDTESEKAILAGKELARLGKLIPPTNDKSGVKPVELFRA